MNFANHVDTEVRTDPGEPATADPNREMSETATRTVDTVVLRDRFGS